MEQAKSFEDAVRILAPSLVEGCPTEETRLDMMIRIQNVLEPLTPNE